MVIVLRPPRDGKGSPESGVLRGRAPRSHEWKPAGGCRWSRWGGGTFDLAFCFCSDRRPMPSEPVPSERRGRVERALRWMVEQTGNSALETIDAQLFLQEFDRQVALRPTEPRTAFVQGVLELVTGTRRIGSLHSEARTRTARAREAGMETLAMASFRELDDIYDGAFCRECESLKHQLFTIVGAAPDTRTKVASPKTAPGVWVHPCLPIGGVIRSSRHQPSWPRGAPGSCAPTAGIRNVRVLRVRARVSFADDQSTGRISLCPKGTSWSSGAPRTRFASASS